MSTATPTRRKAKAAAVGRHPASKVKPDGRGPRKPPGSRSLRFLSLLLIGLTLSLLGLVMVLSASAAGDELNAQPLFHLKRHAMYLTLGATAFLVSMRIDYHRWQRVAGKISITSATLLLIVLLPGIGIRVNGSQRWLGAGPIRFQPSELAKFAVILGIADLLSRRWHRIGDKHATLFPVLVGTGVLSVLIMLEPDLGTVIILATIATGMLFLAGLPMPQLGSTALVAGGVMAMLALAAPYRRDRIVGALDPWADPLNSGYQLVQSQVAIANGGVSGVGLGDGTAKWGWLPFGHTDFIFAVIAEELGLIGAVFVVGLFAALGAVGLSTAMRAPDPFGQLLAGGITTWFLVQAFVNIGAVIGLAPVTGVTLPFISFGGTSLVLMMGAYGILLNVARHTR